MLKVESSKMMELNVTTESIQMKRLHPTLQEFSKLSEEFAVVKSRFKE